MGEEGLILDFQARVLTTNILNSAGFPGVKYETSVIDDVDKKTYGIHSCSNIDISWDMAKANP